MRKAKCLASLTVSVFFIIVNLGFLRGSDTVDRDKLYRGAEAEAVLNKLHPSIRQTRGYLINFP